MSMFQAAFEHITGKPTGTPTPAVQTQQGTKATISAAHAAQEAKACW